MFDGFYKGISMVSELELHLRKLFLHKHWGLVLKNKLGRTIGPEIKYKSFKILYIRKELSRGDI